MRWILVVAAVVVGTAASHAQRAAPPASPFGYAVFGLGDVTLHNDVRAVDGAVGSNDGTTIVGKGVRVAGPVVGRTIKLRKGALPDSLFCLLLEGGSRGGPVLTCQPITLPVMNASQLPAVQVVAGTTAVTVPKGGSTSPIPEGAYGDLRIRSRGVVVLAGGSYVFSSIRVDSRGQLLCADTCQIGVADTVRLRSNAVLGGTGGTRAQDIRVSVARTASRTVFAADKRSTVSAVVYAPGGRIDLRDRGNFVGAFVGGRVRVGRGAIVQSREP